MSTETLDLAVVDAQNGAPPSIEQANNTRQVVRLSYQGESHSISEWSRKTGIKMSTLWFRIQVQGWPPERALTQPVRGGL